MIFFFICNWAHKCVYNTWFNFNRFIGTYNLQIYKVHHFGTKINVMQVKFSLFSRFFQVSHKIKNNINNEYGATETDSIYIRIKYVI